MNSADQLDREAKRFQEWAEHYSQEVRHGEWELDYEDWPALYSAFSHSLKDCPFQTWSQDNTKALLYLIARDNECGILANEVAQSSTRLIFVAEAALATDESSAKWQIAVELAKLNDPPPEVEALLTRFAQDEDEYVRRRALIGLGDMKSPNVESLIEPAWNTGDEYQRMAVLHVLHAINSPQLSEYRDRAVADGRQYLLAFAKKTRLHNKHSARSD